MSAPPTTIHDPELRAALEALFARQTFGIKLGLEPTRALLDAIGNPQESLRFVHVAGTNGKGSVCAMIASALKEAGHRVGLYSSPHLVDFRERMRINGVPISEERLALYAREMMPVIEQLDCTFFEGTTAMALRFFAEENADIVVLETGMGGRLDSTNVVMPLVSVVTSIGLDHVKHLGESYEEIAREKAGIFKKDVPAVVGRVRPRLRGVFEEVAHDVGASLTFVEDCCQAVPLRTSLAGTYASFILNRREFADVEIDLIGRHQVENGRVALAALSLLPDDLRPDEKAIRRGFRAIRRNTGIAGRFEVISRRPPVIVDVAHNADGAKVLVESLREALGGEAQIRFVFGAVRDKDVAEVMRIIAPLARSLYAVSADNPRSLPSDEIAHWSREAGIETTDVGEVARGVECAMQEMEADAAVVIFGSFFVVGEALRHLHRENDVIPGVREEIRPTAIGRAEEERKGVRYDTNDSTANADEPSAGKDRRLTVKDWHPGEQPRERLMKRGAGALTEAELIAILLRTGTKEQDVVQVSQALFRRYKTLSDLAARDYKELQGIAGIGPTKAVTLAAAFELGRRMKTEPFDMREVITGPQDAVNYFTVHLRDARKEQFHVLILNTAGQVIRTQLVSEGNLNSSIVHPREVFRIAIIESAAAIIGLHNHPSGNPTPSKEDIAITRQLIDSGRVLGIPFHDHIIIAGDKHISLVAEGLV